MAGKAWLAEKTVRALTSQYEDVRAEIRARSPRYAALTSPQPLSLTEIQKEAGNAARV